MKKFFKYNVGAAIGALVLIIALSVLGGVNRTVAVRKSAVISRYDSEVAADLRGYKEYAGKFASLAAAAGCDTGRLEAAISALGHSSPFDGGPEAVVSASDAVYAELTAKKDVDETQLRSAKSYYYEMNSTVMRLKENSAYNKAAAKYNKAVSAFPANVITGKHKPATVFDK